MSERDHDLAQWPDQGQVQYWDGVLAEIAERERLDRDVLLRPFLRCDGELLWAHYDDDGPWDRVAGPGADLDADTLFERIDQWVAFERSPAPTVLVERDRTFIAEVRSRLTAAIPNLIRAVELASADVVATTVLRPQWQVVLHEVGEMESPRSEAWERLVQMGRLPAREAVRLPFVSLDNGHPESSQPLRALEAMTVPHAVGTILSEIQDSMIDEVWGAWPACPMHGHPMEADCDNWDSDDNPVYWACPTTKSKITTIGSLTPALD